MCRFIRNGEGTTAVEVSKVFLLFFTALKGLPVSQYAIQMIYKASFYFVDLLVRQTKGSSFYRKFGLFYVHYDPP